LQLRRGTAWLASLLLSAPVALSALRAVFDSGLTPDQFPGTGFDSPFTILPKIFIEDLMLGTLVLLIAFTCLTLLTYGSLVVPEKAAGLLMLIIFLGGSILYLNIGALWGVQLYDGILSGVILGIELGLPLALSLIVTSSMIIPSNWQNTIYGSILIIMAMAPIAGLPLSVTMKAAYPANSTSAFLITYFGIVALGFALNLRNKRILHNRTTSILSKRGHVKES
jgi:hypothetical protein